MVRGMLIALSTALATAAGVGTSSAQVTRINENTGIAISESRSRAENTNRSREVELDIDRLRDPRPDGLYELWGSRATSRPDRLETSQRAADRPPSSGFSISNAPSTELNRRAGSGMTDRRSMRIDSTGDGYEDVPYRWDSLRGGSTSSNFPKRSARAVTTVSGTSRRDIKVPLSSARPGESARRGMSDGSVTGGGEDRSLRGAPKTRPEVYLMNRQRVSRDRAMGGGTPTGLRRGASPRGVGRR
jgi:hypothetical protein